jgi:hypothetical protein
MPSQNGLKNEGEILPNLALDLSAVIIVIISSYKKR